ncbi:glycosyltransferase [Methylobacterium sp. C33D]
MIRIVIDLQTLTSPEINRGIGRVVLSIAKKISTHDISIAPIIVACEDAEIPDWAKDFPLWTLPASSQPPDHIGDLFSSLLNDKEGEFEAVLIGNPMMLNIGFPHAYKGRAKVFLTVYDFIPLESEITNWPANLQSEYMDRLKFLENDNVYSLTISDYVRDDLKRRTGSAHQRSRTIPIGVDDEIFWPLTHKNISSEKISILAVAGDHPRKNLRGTINAFAHLCHSWNSNKELELLLVCHLSKETRDEILSQIKKLKIDSYVRVLNFVHEEALGSLYRNANALLFLSRSEGFGLPIAEAICSGIPVVATDIEVFREVGGDLALYVDPDDLSATSEALRRAITLRAEPSFRHACGTRRSNFSWDISAKQYTTFIKEVCSPIARRRHYPQRLSIAFLTPWPPQKSGVADYSKNLVPYLSDELDVKIFAPELNGVQPDGTLPIRAFDSRQFKSSIYAIGNNATFHREIYDKALRTPGHVLLHDPNIHPFLREAYGTARGSLYVSAVEQELGPKDEAQIKSLDLFAHPMNLELAIKSLSLTLHSRRYALDLCARAQEKGLQIADRIWSISHGSYFEGISNQKRSAGNSFTVGIFGNINWIKRPELTAKVVRHIKDRSYPIRFLVVGEANDHSVDFIRYLKELDVANEVEFTGYVTEAELQNRLLSVDLLLALRWPTLGEASGVVYRAMGFGVPVVCSAIGQFAEIPAGCVWHVPLSENEVDQISEAIMYLYRRPRTAAELGRNGKAYTERFARYDEAGEHLSNLVYQTI